MSAEQKVRQLIKMNPHPDFPMVCGAGICTLNAVWKVRSPRRFEAERFKSKVDQANWRTEYRCDLHAKEWYFRYLEKQETVRLMEDGNKPIENPWSDIRIPAT